MPSKEIFDDITAEECYNEYLELKKQGGLFNGRCSPDYEEKVDQLHYELTDELYDYQTLRKSYNFIDIENLNDRGKLFYYDALRTAFDMIMVLFCPYDSRREMSHTLRTELDKVLQTNSTFSECFPSVEAIESETMFWEVMEHFSSMLECQPYEKTDKFIKYTEYQNLVNKLKGDDK